jgi:hypothetical protein
MCVLVFQKCLLEVLKHSMKEQNYGCAFFIEEAEKVDKKFLGFVLS